MAKLSCPKCGSNNLQMTSTEDGAVALCHGCGAKLRVKRRAPQPGEAEKLPKKAPQPVSTHPDEEASPKPVRQSAQTMPDPPAVKARQSPQPRPIKQAAQTEPAHLSPQSGAPGQAKPVKAAQTRKAALNPAASVYLGGAVDISAIQKAEAEAPLEWNIGDVILDLYEVTGVLGEGGMGKVYKVHHKGWNVELAVKAPKLEMIQRAGGSEAFRQEAETWVNLGLHPHTVSCYYVRDLGRVPRVFAEYVEGGSLHDWIMDRSLYEGGHEKALARMLDIAIQFAWGLHYAHEQGLVHQDVKPANVMMTPDGIAKVTDFGLAGVRAAAGTPPYQSPEQANAASQKTAGAATIHLGRPDRTSDLWSWGVSILEMFAGEVTWMYGALAAAALDGYVENGQEDQRIPRMPDLVTKLLNRCFREEPSQRYRSMLEAAEELMQIYGHVGGGTYWRQCPAAAADTADSLNNRAVSMVDLGRTEEAHELWDAALNLHGHHPESTYNRNLLLYRADRLDDITFEQRMQGMQASSPGNWWSHYLTALAHMETSDYRTAVATLEGISEQSDISTDVATALSLARSHVTHSKGVVARFEVQKTDSYYWGTGVESIVLGPDETLVALTHGHEIQIWDLSAGNCLHRLLHPHPTGHINCLLWTHDCRQCVSVNKTVRVWDVATGCLVSEFATIDRFVDSAGLSADGRLTLVDNGGYLIIFDIGTGALVRETSGNTDYRFVAVSGDGRVAIHEVTDRSKPRIVTRFRCLDTASLKCLSVLKENREEIAPQIRLSFDGRYAVIWYGDHEYLFSETTSGQCLHTIESEKDGAVYLSSACFSKDSHRIVTWTTHDMTLRAFPSGKCLTVRRNGRGIWKTYDGAVCMNREGTMLLTRCENEVEMFSFGQRIPDWTAPLAVSRVRTTEEVLEAKVSFDEKLRMAREALNQGDAVQAAQYVRGARSVEGMNRASEARKVWSDLCLLLPRAGLRGAWQLMSLDVPGGVLGGFCTEKHGRAVVFGNSIKVWDVETGTCVSDYDRASESGPWELLRLSDDGSLALVTARGEFGVLNMKTGDIRTSFTIIDPLIHAFCLTPCGRYAIFQLSSKNYQEKRQHLYDTHSGKILRTFFEQDLYGFTTSYSVSRDGRYFLRIFDDRLEVWDFASWKRIPSLLPPDHKFDSIYLGTDCRYVFSLDKDGIARQWDFASGNLYSTLSETDLINIGNVWLKNQVDVAASLTYDNRYALFGFNDGRLEMWDISNGTCLQVLRGHSSGIRRVCLSRDGTFAISNDSNDKIIVWALDWELEDRQPADWDERARPYLEIFLTQHMPYSGPLPDNGKLTAEGFSAALTKRGTPTWTEPDFQELLYTLGCVGYGWLRPEGVREQLKVLAREMPENGFPLPYELSAEKPIMGEELIPGTEIRCWRCGNPSYFQEGSIRADGVWVCYACGVHLLVLDKVRTGKRQPKQTSVAIQPAEAATEVSDKRGFFGRIFGRFRRTER